MRFAKMVAMGFLVFGLVGARAFAAEDFLVVQKIKNLELAMSKKDSEISELRGMIQELSKTVAELRTEPASRLGEGSLETRIGRLEQKVDQFTRSPVVTEKTEEIKKFKEYVCKKGHLFSALPENGVCPIDGTKIKVREVLKKIKLARRESVAEKIEAALEEEKKKQVVVGASGTGVFQQVVRSQRSKDSSFAEGSLDLIFVSSPIVSTNFFADLEAIGGNGPDAAVHSSTGLNADAGSLQDTDGVDRVSVREAWIGGNYFNEHLRLAAGKLDLTNYFDTNGVANDETTQFLSNAFVNNSALQQPRNGPGLVAYYDTKKSFRLGTGVQNPTDSGTRVGDRPYAIAELDYNSHLFFGRDGNYRIWGRMNGARADDNKGFGISFDQVLVPTLTAFTRYGFNEREGAVNKYAWSAGLEKRKLLDSRPLDFLGMAVGQQEGTRVKVDTLGEIYYRLFLTDHLTLSPHLQWLIRSSRPDDLEKEENVFVLGLRSQVDF